MSPANDDTADHETADRVPRPGEWVVVFRSRRDRDASGYAEAAARMEAVARRQPGFVGMTHAGDDDGGITVCYWESEEAIAAWRAEEEHRSTQEQGRSSWYTDYDLVVGRVDHARSFTRP